MDYLRLLMLLAVVVLVGCSDSGVTVDEPASLPAAENAKVILQDVAETGQMGSGTMDLRSNLEQVEQSEALLADLDVLQKMTDPEEIKAKAKEMADKL